MARPSKEDPADITTSLRITTTERDYLHQLASLDDLELGHTPNAVIRALVAKEARRRHLAPTEPAPEVTEVDLEPAQLAKRIRRLEKLYEQVVAPHMLKLYAPPLPTPSVIPELLKQTGMSETRLALYGRARMGETTPVTLRKPVLQLLVELEARWSNLKKS